MNYNSNKNHDKGVKHEPRFYRDFMGIDRFVSFVITYRDSDLWIGIDTASYNKQIPEYAKNKLIELRNELENYIHSNPEFASSLSPVGLDQSSPPIAKAMTNAGQVAKTGPMAAVAGAFSEFIGKSIQESFNVKEIVVENGGDIYLSLQKDIVLSIFAGNSPLSQKVGIEIPANKSPIGICTSAGTVGPSISFGKADAVVVASKNTLIADAYATSIANNIKDAKSINTELENIKSKKEIVSLLIICDGQIGIKGEFELKLLKDR